MQYDREHTSLVVGLERELRVDGLVEELLLGRSEDLNRRLPGELRKDPGILPIDRQHEIRSEFVSPVCHMR